MQMFQAQWKSWGTVKWRSLSWAEFKKFEQQAGYTCPMGVANDIYRAVVLLGPDIEEATAGLIEFIVSHIFSKSSFTGNADILEVKLKEKRLALENDYLISAKAVIASMFNYKFEEIDQWDEDKFLEILTQAEFVAGKQLPVGRPEPPKVIKHDRKGPLDKDIPEEAKNKVQKRPVTPAQQAVLDRMNGR